MTYPWLNRYSVNLTEQRSDRPSLCPTEFLLTYFMQNAMKKTVGSEGDLREYVLYHHYAEEKHPEFRINFDQNSILN